jgi:hypothetical protein
VKAAVAESKPLQLRLAPGLAEQRSAAAAAARAAATRAADALATLKGGKGSKDGPDKGLSGGDAAADGSVATQPSLESDCVGGCPCLPVPALPGAWALTGLLLGPSVRGFASAVNALRSAAAAADALASTPEGAAQLGGAVSCCLDFYLAPPPPVADPDAAAHAAAGAQEAAKQASAGAAAAAPQQQAASSGGPPVLAPARVPAWERAAALKRLQAARASYPYPPVPPTCDVVLLEGAFLSVRLVCSGESQPGDDLGDLDGTKTCAPRAHASKRLRVRKK